KPNATSSSTVIIQNCVSGSWKTTPTAWLLSPGFVSLFSTPCTNTFPLISPSSSLGKRPFKQEVRVLFPLPLGPKSSTLSPRFRLKLSEDRAFCFSISLRIVRFSTCCNGFMQHLSSVVYPRQSWIERLALQALH